MPIEVVPQQTLAEMLEAAVTKRKIDYAIQPCTSSAVLVDCDDEGNLTFTEIKPRDLYKLRPETESE